MSRSERRRLGWAWGVSLALAAFSGALVAWWIASAAPAGWAVPLGALVAGAAAVGLALRGLRLLSAVPVPPQATPAIATSTVSSGGAARRDGTAADTHPAVWSDTLDPAAAEASAAGHHPPSGSPTRVSTPAVPPAASPGASEAFDASGGPGVSAPTADHLQGALRQALEAGEMRLVYQPVFHLAARQVHAVEALLRWPQGSKALLPPEDIVAIADRGGFGAAMARFVLGAAAQQLVRWRHVLGTVAPRRVSINLSRRQCLSDDLLDDFEQVLVTHGLRSDAFQFELAERDLAADASVEVRLHELRALGAGVALDRFGEANASLAGLQRWPLDTVKVDGHLIRRAEASDNARLVLRSTLDLAAQLGLEVVAEGVETPAQLSMLRELGCELAQGHALCPPTDPFALTRRLRGGHWLAEATLVDPARAAS